MQPSSRACTKCELIKPLSEFSKAPRGKYGVKASCKACDAARHAAITADRVPKDRRRRYRDPIDPSSPKTCSKCGITKTHADFSLARKATETTNAVYRSVCKPCSSERAMGWFRDNQDRARANSRRLNLQKLYGLTQQQYDDMVRAQGGVCAICGQTEPSGRGRSRGHLTVDHCHDDDVVRGLLCNRCNRALGLLGDDAVILRKAISYLLRHTSGGSHQGGQ